MKNIVPIIMAGVLGIYGLIVSVIIIQSTVPPTGDKHTQYSMFNGYAHMSYNIKKQNKMKPPKIYACLTSLLRISIPKARIWLAAGGTIGIIGDQP